MLSFKKRTQLSNVCLLFLWRGSHFGTWESLGSSSVKMSQAFHDPSICFNFSYFHRKVNAFKTPEMCLCMLRLRRLSRMFTIIFVVSFHYFKLVSCWFQFCKNVAGVPRPFDQLQSRMGKETCLKLLKCTFISTQTF